MGKIITQESDRSKRLNELLQGLHDLYKDDVEQAVYLCYDKGATVEEVAQALGVTKAEVSRKFPKKGKHE